MEIRSSRLIPGRNLRCLTAAGPFGEKEESALSANDHPTPENVPILNFNSSGKRSLEVRIIGHRALESGIALHIHQLDKVSGDGNKIVQTHTWTQSEMSNRSRPFRREGRVSPFCERSSYARERPNTQLQLQRQEIP